MITKQAIAIAMQGLMSRKSLDKITVKDIVEECHITRQTFYYHFKDILDLLEWGLEQNMQQLLRSCQACESMEDALLNCVRELDRKEYQRMFANVLRSRYRDAFQQVLLRELKLYFAQMFHEKELLGDVPAKEAMFLVEFYSGAMALMLGQWSLEGRPDIEERIRMAVRTMRGELHI